MNEQERLKLHDVCYRSKKGERLSVEELAFIEKMHKKHHSEYCLIQRKAAEEAVSDEKKKWACGR